MQERKACATPLPYGLCAESLSPALQAVTSPTPFFQKCLYSAAENQTIFFFFFLFLLLNKTDKSKPVNSPYTNTTHAEQPCHHLFHQPPQRRLNHSCDEVSGQPGSPILLLHCFAPLEFKKPKPGAMAAWAALLCAPFLKRAACPCLQGTPSSQLGGLGETN